MSRIRFSDVRARATGRWEMVLSALTQGALAPAMQVAHKQKQVTCPLPGHKKDEHASFRLFKDWEETGGGICSCGSYPNGFSLLMALRGGDIKTIYDEVAEVLGMIDKNGVVVRDRLPALPPPKIKRGKSPEQIAAKDEELAQLLNRTRAESIAHHLPEAEPLRLYIKNRGLDPAKLPTAVRFHPELPYFEFVGDKLVETGRYPAMICQVQSPTGLPITLHRTYLTADGKKAPVGEAKKLMRARSSLTVSGGAIRLAAADGPVLGIAEGIETALAVIAGTNMPVWATVSANGMTKFEIPEHVRTLLVWADLDRSFAGQKAAQALADRYQGKGVEISFLLPPGPIPANSKGVDWLDIYVARGARGFPQVYPRPQSIKSNPPPAAPSAAVTVLPPRPLRAGKTG